MVAKFVPSRVPLTMHPFASADHKLAWNRLRARMMNTDLFSSCVRGCPSSGITAPIRQMLRLKEDQRIMSTDRFMYWLASDLDASSKARSKAHPQTNSRWSLADPAHNLRQCTSLLSWAPSTRMCEALWHEHQAMRPGQLVERRRMEYGNLVHCRWEKATQCSQ